MIFKDRLDAGEKLADNLKNYKNDSSSIILSIPRGGVGVGFYVAKKLNLPMNVIIAKKIGAPFNPELAIGAIAEKETVILNDQLIESYNIYESYVSQKINEEKNNIEKKIEIYRNKESLSGLENKDVILVDDGIATGATIKASIKFIKKSKAKKIIVATPVGERETIEEIKKMCDEVVCLEIPDFFNAVGSFYENFNQVSDEEVVNFIKDLKK